MIETSPSHFFLLPVFSTHSAVALCKLLEHAVKANDTRFHHIDVKGDPIIITTDAGVRTRSKTAQGT